MVMCNLCELFHRHCAMCTVQGHCRQLANSQYQCYWCKLSVPYESLDSVSGRDTIFNLKIGDGQTNQKYNIDIFLFRKIKISE